MMLLSEFVEGEARRPNVGRRPVHLGVKAHDDRPLRELEAAVLFVYIDGLADAGWSGD